jgi:putative two-component system response regulator
MRIQRPELTELRILIVDDEEDNVFLFERILHQAGYNETRSTTDSRKAMETYRQFRPDLIILDLHMPAPSGFDILEQIGLETAGREYMPVLVVTADVSAPTCLKALGLGAKDFLTKPIDRLVFLLRTRNLLETRMLYRKMEDKARSVAAGGIDGCCDRDEIVTALARAAQFRVDPAGDRLRRISGRCAGVARALGMSQSEVNEISLASMLSDIGKLCLPDHIAASERDSLDASEREIYRKHAEFGANLLSGYRSSLLNLARTIAHSHHERWDGEGYPLGLSAQAIPLQARIVAVAEFVDEICSSTAAANDSGRLVRNELTRQSGFRFDPGVVSAMLSLLEQEQAQTTRPAG